MISKIKSSLLAFMLLVGATLSAQQIQVSAKLDSTGIYIGDQTMLHLQAVVADGLEVTFPTILDTLVKGVEVLEVSPIDTTTLKGGLKEFTQSVLITSFDSAVVLIPPFDFVVAGDTVATNALGLKVVTLDVDTESKQIFDIKPIVEPEFVLMDYANYLYIALLILALIAGGYFGYKRWKLRKMIDEGVFSPEPLLPAADEARIGLAELKEQQLWQKGMEKEYYTRLTDILRNYLFRRYGIYAMEMTSAEIIVAIKDQAVEKDLVKNLKGIFDLSDLVKFAKYRPVPEENEQCMYLGGSFVDATEERVVTETPEDETAEAEESASEIKK